MNSLIVLLALVLAGSQARVPQTRATPATHATNGIYRIAGMIVDANSGAPIPGAQLSISRPGNGGQTTADDTGHFSFDALPPGTYMLSASAHGYVSASYDQHGQFSTGIVVGNAIDSEHIVFQLPPQGVIYGTVTDSQGDTVRQAQVTLFEVEPLSGLQRPVRRANAQTNDLGQYRLAHLNEGRYYVAVQARPWYAEPGFTHPPEQQPGSGSFTDYQKNNPLLDVVYPVTFFPGVADPAAANELHIVHGDQQEADVELTPVPSADVLVTGLPPDPPNGPAAYP
ncbi:MAG: carboxypeptidase regulatory-like domain-containing protein, partial [Candidatus Acidiferrales bacterium]